MVLVGYIGLSKPMCWPFVWKKLAVNDYRNLCPSCCGSEWVRKRMPTLPLTPVVMALLMVVSTLACVTMLGLVYCILMTVKTLRVSKLYRQHGLPQRARPIIKCLPRQAV